MSVPAVQKPTNQQNDDPTIAVMHASQSADNDDERGRTFVIVMFVNFSWNEKCQLTGIDDSGAHARWRFFFFFARTNGADDDGR